MTNPMTPTEQDKELREQIVAVMFEDEWFHCSEHGSIICAEASEERSKALSRIMPLITADRKRVALEARIDELIQLSQSEVMFFNNDYKQAKLIRERIAELKAQQEEAK